MASTAGATDRQTLAQTGPRNEYRGPVDFTGFWREDRRVALWQATQFSEPLAALDEGNDEWIKATIGA